MPTSAPNQIWGTIGTTCKILSHLKKHNINTFFRTFRQCLRLSKKGFADTPSNIPENQDIMKYYLGVQEAFLFGFNLKNSPMLALEK
jgi:hypothetical protein